MRYGKEGQDFESMLNSGLAFIAFLAFVAFVVLLLFAAFGWS